MTKEQTNALAASADAAEAAAALIRFAREGECLPNMAFDVAVSTHLAAALKEALQIELPRFDAAGLSLPQAEHDAANRLLAAVELFLEHWA